MEDIINPPPKKIKNKYIYPFSLRKLLTAIGSAACPRL